MVPRKSAYLHQDRWAFFFQSAKEKRHKLKSVNAEAERKSRIMQYEMATGLVYIIVVDMY